MRATCAGLLLVVFLPLASCGAFDTSPTDSLGGTWLARGIGRGLSFTMTIAQSGDDIVGFACGVSDGAVIFKESPVTGDIPDVQFVVTQATVSGCCAHLVGFRFAGKASRTAITGSSDFGSDLRFERSPTAPACDARYGKAD